MMVVMCVCEVVYLQDGGLGAALAGLDVADHSSFRHFLVIEAEAALFWASTAHTCKQTGTS